MCFAIIYLLNTYLGRKDEFEAMIAALEKCQKSLTEYLRDKRIIFPRFNFISDDELLSILGNPMTIQEHVGKMFDNLDKFALVQLDGTDRLVATALISCEREVMGFRNPVSTEDQIEIWMGLVLEEMKRSNRYLTKKAVYNYGKVYIPDSLKIVKSEEIDLNRVCYKCLMPERQQISHRM